MVYYSGYTSEYGLKLIIIGDGETKTVAIDLRKMPIGMDFQGNFPKQVFMRSADAGSAPAGPSSTNPVVTMNEAVLTLDFPDPLPAPGAGTLSPRCQLDVILLY